MSYPHHFHVKTMVLLSFQSNLTQSHQHSSQPRRKFHSFISESVRNREISLKFHNKKKNYLRKRTGFKREIFGNNWLHCITYDFAAWRISSRISYTTRNEKTQNTNAADFDAYLLFNYFVFRNQSSLPDNKDVAYVDVNSWYIFQFQVQ